MKCSLGTDERWPMLTIDSVNTAGDENDIPPRLLNALQAAEKATEKAEREIIRHCQKTNQYYPKSVARALDMEEE